MLLHQCRDMGKESIGFNKNMNLAQGRHLWVAFLFDFKGLQRMFTAMLMLIDRLTALVGGII